MRSFFYRNVSIQYQHKMTFFLEESIFDGGSNNIYRNVLHCPSADIRTVTVSADRCTYPSIRLSIRPSVRLSVCPSVISALTLWRPVVPHGYSYKASYARPG